MRGTIVLAALLIGSATAHAGAPDGAPMHNDRMAVTADGRLWLADGVTISDVVEEIGNKMDKVVARVCGTPAATVFTPVQVSGATASDTWWELRVTPGGPPTLTNISDPALIDFAQQLAARIACK